MTSPRHRRLLFVVIDGLGSRALDRSLADGHAPTLRQVLDAGGQLNAAVSPFPSLTPVCLATIITGSLPDRHRIPSLSWYHRGERRFVEYGSSFSAAAAVGMSSTIRDVVFNLNHVHLAEHPRTLFEELEDEGHVAACINYLVYRGRSRHTIKYPSLTRLAKRVGQLEAVYGPEYFYWGELFGHSRPILPQVGIKRPKDWSAAHVARWLLRNTPSDFVLLYLGQHDVASHKAGPDDTEQAVRLADRSVARVIESMGGLERFLEECALVVCADHGQTSVESGQQFTLSEVFDNSEVYDGSRGSSWESSEIAICPSNRCAMAYRLHDASPEAGEIADRMLEAPAVDIVAYGEDGRLVVRRGDARLEVRRDSSGTRTEYGANVRSGDRWQIDGDLEALDLHMDGDIVCYGAYPDALARVDAATQCINAGDVIVSARVGWEFTDMGGQFHTGGSHGSLHELDSLAPLITVGLDGDGPLPHEHLRLADVAPYIRSHFAT